MPQTVEVRFKGTRRGFYLWPDGQEPLRLSEPVIVQADRGQDFGRVHSAGEVAEKKCGGACQGCERGSADPTPLVAAGELDGPPAGAAPTDPPDDLPESPDTTPAEAPAASTAQLPAPGATPPRRTPDLRPILRRATQDEVRLANELRRQEEEARRQVGDKIREHRLEMRVSDAEWQWDRGKLTVFFTAEKRVDFRNLVRDLAGLFRARIELRQIGVRDEAARLGGVGRCGREYCCSTWLGELSPVSLALAKDQHLSLNPTQISGGCGRLLCCLRYEHEFYVAARKRFPREGKTVGTARGKERVIAVDIFRERVFLRHDEQGPRIVPLVQLREEMEHASDGTLPPATVPAPAQGPGPRPRREHPPRREGTPRERDQRAGPGGPRTGRAQAVEPAKTAPPPPDDASPPPPPPTTGGDATGERPRKSRRRRRGRRGGRGPSGGPSNTPPSPEA